MEIESVSSIIAQDQSKHVRKYKGEKLRKQQDKSKAQNKMLETYLNILLIMININILHNFLINPQHKLQVVI